MFIFTKFLKFITSKLEEAVGPKKETVDPTIYGWVDEDAEWKKRPGYKPSHWDQFPKYVQGKFSLYQCSHGGYDWRFQLQKKKEPGCIAMFSSPLLEEDLLYMQEVINSGRYD